MFIKLSPLSYTLSCSGTDRRRIRWTEDNQGRKWGQRRQMEADSMREEKIWTREQKGMRQKGRQRGRTQQGERTGRSVTRLRPHLFSASLPIRTINQQREQGKINKNSPAGTTARRTIASFTDKSPHPSSNSILSLLTSSCRSIYP